MKRILIIGAGLAGLTAAIKTADNGSTAILVSPSPSERAQSVMAMGGINVAFNTKGQDDSIEEHYRDTIKGGNYLNSPKAVKKLTEDAPTVVKWLESIGTSFTRDENGNIDLRYFGGQKKMRTAYAGARTGKQIVSALIAECRKKEVQGNVKRYVGYRFISLIINEDNECTGAVIYNEDTYELKEVHADAVIIATGGLNKIFGKTSGTVQNDGYTTAKLLSQGVELANLEMIQYHPTTIDTPVKRMLITEAARGEGGRLYVLRDGKPWYFMEEWYPEMGALMPRDVVSRSIYKVCHELNLGIDGKNQVYLDISFLPPETIETKLDEVLQVCLQYIQLDPRKEPIPVYPGIHYFMGGIRTNEKHETNIKRLYAAGECSAQYHGANRLGGNSVLGAVHGGWIAAKEADKLDELDTTENNSLLNIEKEKYYKWANITDNNYPSYKIEQELAAIMMEAMGIFRNKEQLQEALEKLENLYHKTEDANTYGDYYEYIKLPAQIRLAQAIVKSALERKESRGSHQRIEYPKRDDENYKKTTCIQLKDNRIEITFKDLE